MRIHSSRWFHGNFQPTVATYELVVIEERSSSLVFHWKLNCDFVDELETSRSSTQPVTSDSRYIYLTIDRETSAAGACRDKGRRGMKSGTRTSRGTRNLDYRMHETSGSSLRDSAAKISFFERVCRFWFHFENFCDVASQIARDTREGGSLLKDVGWNRWALCPPSRQVRTYMLFLGFIKE